MSPSRTQPRSHHDNRDHTAEARGVLTIKGGEPRLTTPDFFDVNKYAAEGNFPGSIRIPGTDTSFQIGSFVLVS